MRRFLNFLFNRKGGLSFGGGGNNSLRDTVNTINSGGGVPSAPVNSVQFNKAGAFGGDDRFKFVQGVGILVGEDVCVYFNANGGAQDAYVKYNSATDYLEIYVDDLIRAQF